MDDKRYSVEQKQFWFLWMSKFLFTLISVKFWGLVGSISISTYLIIIKRIEATEWVTFNTTIWGLIFGMKEIFRVMESKDNNENKMLEKKVEAKETLAKIEASTKTSLMTETAHASRFTPDGKEIVGTEPN